MFLRFSLILSTKSTMTLILLPSDHFSIESTHLISFHSIIIMFIFACSDTFSITYISYLYILSFNLQQWMKKRITSRVVIMHNRLELYDWFSHASLSLLFALCLIPIHCKVTNPFTVFNKHTTPIIPPSPFATISPPYTA